MQLLGCRDLAGQRFAGGFPVSEMCDALLAFSEIVVGELLYKPELADYKQELRKKQGDYKRKERELEEPKQIIHGNYNGMIITLTTTRDQMCLFSLLSDRKLLRALRVPPLVVMLSIQPWVRATS